MSTLYSPTGRPAGGGGVGEVDDVLRPATFNRRLSEFVIGLLALRIHDGPNCFHPRLLRRVAEHHQAVNNAVGCLKGAGGVDRLHFVGDAFGHLCVGNPGCGEAEIASGRYHSQHAEYGQRGHSLVGHVGSSFS